MSKMRPFYGVSVPANPLGDERALRTFLEHLCDALGAINGAINPGGASAPFTTAAPLYQSRRVFFGSETGGMAQDSTLSFGRQSVTGAPSILDAPRVRLGQRQDAPGGAPLYFRSGSLLTTIDAGAIEFDGTYWYGTNSQATQRRRFAFHDELSASGVWTRNTSGTAFLHPTTVADLVSIGAATVPTGSALLGLWGRAGIAHTNTSAASGDMRASWPAFASLSSAEQTAAGGAHSREPWVLGTETDNGIFFRVNGTNYLCLMTADAGAGVGAGTGSLLPLVNGTQHLGYGGYAWRGVYALSGAGNGFHIVPTGGSDYGTLIHDGTWNLTLNAGLVGGRLIFAQGGINVAKVIRPGGNSRFCSASDNVTDLGGRAGTTDNERWRDLFNRHLVSSSGNAPSVSALSAGWGATASASVRTNSRDTCHVINVTAGGAGIAANPTVTVTFGDSFGSDIGWPVVQQLEVVAGEVHGQCKVTQVSATTYQFRWLATPVAGETYRFIVHTIGSAMAAYP